MKSASDVIIVGAGFAGLMCAKILADSNKAVTIIYDGDFKQTSSFYAQGGIAGAWLDDDSTLQHMTDTIMAGDGLCDTKVVQYFCDKAPNLIKLLIELGVPFDKNLDGTYRLTKEGAHSFSRIFHVKDYTGHAIIQTLVSKLKSNNNINWVNESIDGLVQNSETKAIIGVTIKGEKRLCSTVILATGGFSNIFSLSTNPKKNVGEGIALAYAAGAKLADLEFIQYHPTVYCKDGFAPLLISEALRGEGAFLVNKNNERFMENYHPLKDLAPRDVVARALFNEQEPKLNIAALMPTISVRFPTIFEALKIRGFSLQDYEIPVQPLVHYTLGGIVANVNGQTSLNGLYAIGECATTGFHGANRLASNSLLEAGQMGVSCAEYLNSVSVEPVMDDSDYKVISIAPLPEFMHIWLGGICRDALSVIRSKDSIEGALNQIYESNSKDHPLVSLVKAILNSALYRTESRGGHYRSDFLKTYDYAHHSFIQKDKEIYHNEFL